MIEPLDELNKICQKPDYKTKGNWMVRHLLRDAALPITRALLRTQITANQVTLISIGIGILAAMFLGLSGKLAFILGCGLLQLWYLFDHVDGQIARYRKTACLSGRYFDFLMHHLVHALILFALGFYSFNESGQRFYIIFGFIGSISTVMFNLIYDIQAKTFLEVIDQMPGLKVQGISESKEIPVSAPPSIKKRAFSLLHKSFEIHVMMNTLTALAIVQLFLKADLRFFALAYYGIASVVLAVMKNSYIILRRKVDQDFDNKYKSI